VPPLDGYSVLGLFVSEDWARKIEDAGRQFRPLAFIALGASWTVLDKIFDPLFSVALNVLYWGSHYS
jgi:hypothetical protein